MFKNHPTFQELAEKVFILKGAIPKEKVEMVNNLMKDPANHNSRRSQDHDIEWFTENNETPSIPEMFEIWEMMSDAIYPDHVIHPQLSMMISRPGEPGMFVHSDSPGKDMDEDLVSEDRWSTCCNLEYGIIAYFGEFTGGKVYYPHLYKDGTVRPEEVERDDLDCFEIQPEPGDIVIHSACHPYEHGVRPVDSGIRYAFANFMLTPQDNPGTFYNYKTAEYEERVKNFDEWVVPLKENPLFVDGKKVTQHKI